MIDKLKRLTCDLQKCLSDVQMYPSMSESLYDQGVSLVGLLETCKETAFNSMLEPYGKLIADLLGRSDLSSMPIDPCDTAVGAEER